MKARINKYNKACMLVGYYNQDREYREEIFEEVDLKKMHKSISHTICLSNDINIYVFPRIEVRVFAKNRKDIERCLEINGDPSYFKKTLDCFSKHCEPVDGAYLYSTFDLEQIIKELAIPPVEF